MAVTLVVAMLGMPQAAADAAPGLLRIAHLSPDTPAVDVALAPLPAGGASPVTDAGPDVATGLTYGDVSAYTDVTPGSYAVSLRPAGSPPTTPPSLTARVEVPAGAARTVAVSGLFADLALAPLPDDLSAPPPGTARVRVVSAARTPGPVDVTVQGGPALAAALAPGAAAGGVEVPAGPAAVVVDGAAPVTIDWPPGSVSTLLVLDTPGGLTVRSVLDAAGPAIAPSGAVAAGGGGTSGAPGALPWFAVTGLLLLAGTGLLHAATARRARVLALVTAAVLSTAPVPALAAPAPAPPAVTLAPGATPAAAAAPVRLQVPSAGVDTALAAIDLDGAGALVPPSDDTFAGWYRGGPSPGDTGPAVVAGHVDSVAGPAVFFRLREVAPGDPVSVTRADGTTVRFTVTRVARYPKSAFPAAEVYAPTARPELRLITCGGAFDRTAGSYLDNVVVYAQVG